MLWPRPSGSEPGALLGCVGEEAGRDGGLNAIAAVAAGRTLAQCLDRLWHQLEQRHGKSGGAREMIALVRVGSMADWGRLIAAVEEALRLGVTDAAAVLHILHMPDPEQRRQYAIALSEELAQFERPMPVMDDYDLLLTGAPGGIQ